jgi:putative sporulation protein YtaF
MRIELLKPEIIRGNSTDADIRTLTHYDMKDLHLLSILLLAVSSSLDNFGTGVSYGLRNVCIPFPINLFIAFLNSSGTLLAMLFGRAVSGKLQPHNAGLFGALLLICMGVRIFASGIRKKAPGMKPVAGSVEEKHVPKRTFFSMISSALDDPFATGLFCSGKVKTQEGVILAAALTLSNITTGIGAGLIGFNPVLTTVAVFMCSILAVSMGMNVGHYSSALMIRGMADKTSGLLLVLIGLLEMAG